MQSFGSLFEKELKVLINAECESVKNDLERFTDGIERLFKNQGKLLAFRKVEELMEEAAKLADQSNR